jgi:hypothetical protein
LPDAWPAVPPAASRRARGFGRNRRRRSVIAGRRPAAAKSLQPPDFLHVRHQGRIGRIAHQLHADAVGLHGHNRRAPPAHQVRASHGLQQSAQLDLDRLPAVGVVEQLLDLGGRLADGLRHLVRGVHQVDRRPELGLGHLRAVKQHIPLPCAQKPHAGDAGEHCPQLLHDLLGGLARVEWRRPRGQRGGGTAGSILNLTHRFLL